MKIKLRAIGRSVREGTYAIAFYYEMEGGCRDVSMPSWEIPAVDYAHMQAVVNAFNRD